MYHPSPLKQFFHSTRQALAQKWLASQSALQIALTGSHGKTNTRNVLSEILSAFGSTVATDLNLDTVYNVPITALKVLPTTQYAIFELGVDHPREMDSYLEIVKPIIGIITGIAPVHTDKGHLGSLDNVIREKRKLIEALPSKGYSILNYDDENIRLMASRTKAHVIWYGTDRKHCDVYVDPKIIAISLKGTSCTVKINNDQKYHFVVHTGLIGKHHIYTIMAAYATMVAINKLTDYTISLYKVTELMKYIKPLQGRMSLESGPMKTIILNDSLRANPASTRAGLETLSELQHATGRKIAVLAEMGELEHPEAEHGKIGEVIGKLKPDFFIGIGPLQKIAVDISLKTGMKEGNAVWVKDVHEAAEVLRQLIRRNDLIYLKGSLLRHVERVLLILENRKVGCTVTVCPFYHHCLKCSYLRTGYRNEDTP